MTSFADLEHYRTDYFDGVAGDAFEPSSSPSEGSPSPLQPLTEEALAGLAGRSASTPPHAAGREPIFSEGDSFHRFRKGHRSHARDSSSSSSKKLSSLLMLTSERLDKETRRANDAERRAMEAIALARSTNEAKLIAQRDATRANEELRLYKLQYDNAQQEIFKAQELIDQIEAARLEAEAAAARARSTARKLKEQNLIIIAREEGRQLGYQEGLATGRRMAYDERMTPGDYTEESESEDEVLLPEQPSNIRLRSPTPGTGSRPSSRPPAARQPPPPPPPPMRPPSRSTHTNFESASRPSTLVTPAKSQQPTHLGPPPPPIHVAATPPPKNRARSKSDPLGYPPDNWIPVADDKSYIAMPPPHSMSPTPSSVTLEPPVPVPSPAPVPPPPVIDEEAPVETSTTSETSSETVPTQPAGRLKDYVYHALKPRERDGQSQRSRTTAPLSPGSTRMSDFGILSSPQADGRRIKVPVEAQHFEIERSSSPAREKPSRSWSLRRKKEDVPSPVRVSVSPAPIPPPATEGMIAAPRARRPGKSPLSRMSPSSSSSSSTTTEKPSSSGTSSTDRTKLDPRKDSGHGGDARTHIGWLFKKRAKEYQEKGGTSTPSVDITIESPSESGRSMEHITPEQQPSFLSPDYRGAAIPPEMSTSTPKTTGGNQNLPPLSEFTNLISPGQGGGTTSNLPPGFVPNPQLSGQLQQGDGGGGQPLRRSSSTKSRRKDKEPAYEAAPLTAGVHYPTPPSGADPVPRSRSRASRSSRQGQVPGTLGTP